MKKASTWATSLAADLVADLRKDRRAGYLSRLKTQLELLRKTFIEPSMRNARARLWPREEDFRELDECIFGLARTIRLKKLLAYDEAIVLVDRKWRELRLATTLTGLMRAALNDKRQFAKAPEAVVHLNR